MKDRHTPNDTDPEIFLLKGEAAGFARLYKHYQPLLFGIALSYLSSRSLAADAVQDVFLSLWNKRSEIEPRVLKPYIFQMMRNHSLDVLRQKKEHASLENMETEPETNGFTEQMDAKETGRKARDLIQALSPQCRIVFLLVRFEKLSYRETAEVLNLSVKTVENHMGRALKALRSGLDTGEHETGATALIFLFAFDFQLDTDFFLTGLGV